MVGGQGHAGRRGHIGSRPFQAGRFGIAGVDNDRAELDPRLVLEGVGRLDRLGDRQLLGQGDQDHPAAGRVGEQVDHVLGLGAQGPPRAASTMPAAEVRKVMAWPVAGASTTIRSAAPLLLELLDLAQHQHVADAGNGGRHHVEHARAGQPAGHPSQAVALEILDQGVVGRDAPAADRALATAGRITPQDLSSYSRSPVRPKAPAMPDLPSSSTMSTERPA